MKFFKVFLPALLFCLTSPIYAQIDIELVEIASGLSTVVKIANAGDERLFVAERAGRIKIIDADGSVLATPFLDIDSRVILTGGQSEQGLLGLAFHPDYANTGFFYVHYTNNSGNSEIARFKVSDSDPNIADASSEFPIMSINQPFSNHNGGEIEFGPDGYLYIGLGDGGSANDPGKRAQNPQSLHGKLLRIDISEEPYAVPADNPFVDDASFLPEIWAWGIRNPWRFSFDTKTGDLWIADVGQWEREEIDFQPASSGGGENYGWRCIEGDITNPNIDTSGCAQTLPYVDPIFEYPHPAFGACSITGGFVYRGCKYPAMYGQYFYADYCSGDIWGLVRDELGNVNNEKLKTVGTGAWTTFGQGADGEIYITGLNNGKVFQITSGEAVVATINNDLGILSVVESFDTYQWYFDGGLISGATEATYTALESGLYAVEVAFDNMDCSYTSEEMMVIITGDFNIAGLLSFQVQPNPFQDELRLDLVLNQSKSFELKIYSLDGKVVFEKTLAEARKWSEKMDLSELESGVYLLRLIAEEGEIVRKVVRE